MHAVIVPRCSCLTMYYVVIVKRINSFIHSFIIGSPLCAFQWAQYEHHTLSLSLKRGAQKRKVSKIWTIRCDNSQTVRNRMPVSLLLIGSRIRAFDWYRPRWPWMTLNGIIALILRFFPQNSIALLANNVTVIEDRPKMSVKYCLPVIVFHFWL